VSPVDPHVDVAGVGQWALVDRGRLVLPVPGPATQ
jgi:hypothetical protein